MNILKYLSEKVAFQKQRTHRIETLADGVFAIVMTLLVLDIHVPVGNMDTEGDKLISLFNTVPKLLTFVLSFLVAGHFWSVFTNQFNYIHASDRCENIIAILFLLCVSLLPFSSSFLSDHLGSRVAVGFYVFNLLLILLMNLLHWLYAYHSGLVQVKANGEALIHKAIISRAAIALITHCIVAVFCFFNSTLSLLGIIFLQVIFTFSGFIEITISRWRKKPAEALVVDYKKTRRPTINLSKQIFASNGQRSRRLNFRRIVYSRHRLLSFHEGH